jgi:hypothetical protein
VYSIPTFHWQGSPPPNPPNAHLNIHSLLLVVIIS